MRKNLIGPLVQKNDGVVGEAIVERYLSDRSSEFAHRLKQDAAQERKKRQLSCT